MTSAELNQLLAALSKTNQEFFKQAFTDCATGKPYDIPDNLIKASMSICRAYGIKGICDPMYIANVIAFNLGLGDGQNHFTT